MSIERELAGDATEQRNLLKAQEDEAVDENQHHNEARAEA